METFIFVIEIIGTIAFAISGAMTAIKKNMDIFGVMTLGVVTSVGGGILRDLILGTTPPGVFSKPIYVIVAIVCATVVFIPAIRRILVKNHKGYEFMMLLMDSLGLGIFTVVGIQTAHNVSPNYGEFLLIFVGVMSGVGGGVLRDVLAGNTPYIFVKHIYACASIAGAATCTFVWHLNSTYAVIAGAVLTVVIRFLAAHFKWKLPKARIRDGEVL